MQTLVTSTMQARKMRGPQSLEMSCEDRVPQDAAPERTGMYLQRVRAALSKLCGQLLA